jgi:hypothetical protein
MKKKKVIRLTESQLIDLIKQSISEEETNKNIKNKVNFNEFISMVKSGTDGNFDGRYKIENGRFYVKIPLINNPLPMIPYKDWIEIVIK